MDVRHEKKETKYDWSSQLRIVHVRVSSMFRSYLRTYLVGQRIGELWAFIYVTLKQLYTIDFFWTDLPLYEVKKGAT